MLALLPVVGWDGVLSTDEGAAIAQARSLGDNQGFGIAHPFPEADPTGMAFPYEKSATADDGFAPLPKKPLYTVLLAGAGRVGGVPGMIALSIAGTVATAALTARIGRRLHPPLEIVTFWLTGLASPLFVDGYLVIAHTIAAAACAAALLAAAQAIQHRRVSRALLIVPCTIGAVLLRSEAVLLGLALALGSGVVLWRRRDRILAVVAASALVSSIVGFGLDWAITRQLFGTPIPSSASVATSDGAGFLADRARGLLITLVRPGYGSVGTAGLLLILVAVLGLAVVREARLPSPDPRTIRVLAAAALVLAAARLLVPGPPPQLVPGLLVAFPLLAWGLAGLDRAALHNDLSVLLAITGAVFAAFVMATQYAIGGGFEWGGRYFAIGLPCATPLASLGLHHLWGRLNGATARRCMAAAAATTLVLASIGIGAVRTNRRDWKTFTAYVVAAADSTDPGDGGRPVVLTTEPEPPRAAWREQSQGRWLLVGGDEVAPMLERLDELGVQEVLLLTRGETLQPAIAETPYEIVGGPARVPDGDWWMPVLRAR